MFSDMLYVVDVTKIREQNVEVSKSKAIKIKELKLWF